MNASTRRWVRNPMVLGLAFSLLGASAYAAMDVTGKLAYRDGMNVTTLLSLRFLGASFAVLILWRLLGASPLPGRSRLLRFFALGAIGYAAESFLLNSSIARMPVGAVILIFYAYPSLVAVLALAVNRERLGPLKAAALVLSGAGIALLLSFPTEGMNAPGVALAFGAAVAFAGYAVVAEREIEGVNPLVFSGLVLLGAGVSITLIGAATGHVRLELALAAPGWVLLHMGLIATGVIAFLAAVTYLGATRAAIGNTIEPALTVALATVLLGERLGMLQLVGGALLLAAISLLPLTGRTRELALDVPVHE